MVVPIITTFVLPLHLSWLVFGFAYPVCETVLRHKKAAKLFPRGFSHFLLLVLMSFL